MAKLAWGRGPALVAVGVGASSAAVLIFEIALTRVFAITQFYHFAFLTVSLALLGFGASGSALAAFPALGRGGPRRWWLLAFAQALTTLGAFVVVNYLPFDSFAIAWDSRQILYLAVYYVALAVPFFFGGAVIATLLSEEAASRMMASHRVYGASLIGAGVGCVVALVAIDALGGEPTIAVAALIAAIAAAAFEAVDRHTATARFVVTALVMLLLVGLAWTNPSFLEMRLSPYKDLSAALRFPEAEVVSTTWDQGTRVDLVRSDGIRSLAGLSFAFGGAPPPQDGLTFDGDDLSPIPRISPEDAEFAPFMLSSLPFSLRPDGAALVLEPRGGLDVLVALASGVGRVTAIEPHGSAVEAARTLPGSAYDDARVVVLDEDPRAYVAASEAEYDIIDLALTTPYRPVSSGAYSLGEDYRLTVEAFEDYLTHLAPGGIVAAMRWVQTPPSEEMRLVALASEAARRVGADPGVSIVALRSYSNALVLVQPDGFTDDEMVAIREFAATRRFDLVFGPGVDAVESNVYNVVPVDFYQPLAAAIVTGADQAAVYDGYEFDIAPPLDDRPFFAHFFKWAQAPDVLDNLGRTWQPFGGAGYFVLVALLLFSVAGAAALIVAPLLFRRGRDLMQAGRKTRWWTVGYFGSLGIGFLFVEIPLIQQYILTNGSPATALGVVLFAILVSSGIGSLISPKLPWRSTAIVLAVGLAGFAFVVALAPRLVLPSALPVRVAVSALMIVPVGVLMGIMFPAGVRHLERTSRGLVPWAWGINGTVSVISAAASALLTLTFGFTAVMLLGAGSYGAAAILARPSAGSRL